MATLSSSASLLGQQLLFEVFTPITTPQADLCSIHVSRDFLIYKGFIRRLALIIVDRRKFAYAAYARVVLLRRCLRGYSPSSFSPPVRWGLLDFMWVVFSSASSSSPLRPPRPQLRWCELSVPCRTSTAIVWVQRSVPDLNRDHV